MNPNPNRTRPGIWLLAVLLTLAIHLAAVLGVVVLRPFAPGEVQAQNPPPLQVRFADPPTPAPTDANEPERFTELPPDRLDERPEEADFLSNVDSRARDNVAGGESNLPRAEGRAEIPQVAMDVASGAPATPSEGRSETEQEEATPNRGEPDRTAETATPAPLGRGEPTEPETETPQTDPEQVPPGEPEAITSPVTRARDPLSGLRRQPGSTEDRPTPNRSGLSDIFQEEMRNPDGNAGPLGDDISLNTYAWDFAPWMQRFIRDLRENWTAPYAYHMGLTHGFTQLVIEIAPDGRMTRLQVAGHVGHSSLQVASEDAIHATAPFRPLPSHFPEDKLVINLRLIYPEVPKR